MKLNRVLRYLLVFLLFFCSLGTPLSEAAVKASETFPNYSNFGLSFNNIIRDANKEIYPDKSLFDNINLSDNKNVVVNGLAYIDNGFGINGTANFDITGDAYFKGAINVNGTKDMIEIGGNAHINQSVNMSNNSKMVINKDLYIYGNPNFVFNGSESTICVKGDLYYTNNPPLYKTSPFGSEGQGLYVEAGRGGDSPRLDFEVKPSKDSGYIISPETGVALADINSTIIPKGVGGNAVRQTPIDVVFVFDTSGSMVLNMSDRSSDTDKFEQAKKGAINAINKFKGSTIPGDRFAFVPFAQNVGEFKGFNPDTSKIAIDTQLDSIKTSINLLTANGGTNYYAALSKANELFGNSNNPKYVIFLTDGRPDTDAKTGNNSNYPNITINGEFQKQVVTTETVTKKKCFIICWEETETITTKKWSSEKYPININDISVRIEDNNAVFKYNNATYLYLKNYNDLDYAYGMVAASKLASKGAKLYSIGFGSDGDVDINFLNELSSLTGAFAQKGEKADISSIYESLTNNIGMQALRNIKVMVNIKDPSFPGSVTLNDGTVIDDKNLNYAIVNFDDILYKQGITPNQLPSKPFSLRFGEQGLYTFNDVKLSYTDLSNETKTIEGAPFTVKVLKNKNIGMEFAADVYEFDVESKTIAPINLTMEVVPEDEGSEIPEKLTWSSSNNSVATVSNGIVTPKGIGETQIKITALDELGNPIEATTIVKVNLVISGIKFDAPSYQYNAPMDMYEKLNFIYSAPEKNFNITLPSRDELQWGPVGSKLLTMNNGKINRKAKATGGTVYPSGFELITAKIKAPNPETDFYKIKPSIETEAKALIKVNGSSKIIKEPKQQW